MSLDVLALFVLVALGLGFLVVVVLKDYYRILVPYRAARDLIVGGREVEGARLLEQVIERRAFWTVTVQAEARYMLAFQRMKAQRYGEAVVLLQAAVASASPGATLPMRQRLAEALELAGEPDQAQAVRDTVAALARLESQGYRAQVARGKEHSRKGRYVEACLAFEEALTQVPPQEVGAGVSILNDLARCEGRRGRWEATVRYAREAIALNPGPPTDAVAWALAGAGHKALGQLDQAEPCYRQSLLAAEAAGNRDYLAAQVASLANCQLQRGKVQEALDGCARSLAISGAYGSIALATELSCRTLLGEYADALIVLERSRAQSPVPNQAMQSQRERAHLASEAAIWVELGDCARAAVLNARALEHCPADSAEGIGYRAQRAWILAAARATEEARSLADGVATTMAAQPEDRDLERLCTWVLGRAWLELEDWVRAVAAFQRYLTMSPFPVDLPEAHYRLGLALLGSGDVQSGREHLIRAADSGLALHATRLARERLAGLA